MTLLYKITSSIHFRLLKHLSLKNVKSHNDKNKLVYLTFDDGPDRGITEFVLDTLKEYNAVGTFFCLGKCCKANPDLFQRLIDGGHKIGSHTYSHANGHTSTKEAYMKEIESAAHMTNSILFRPPWGAIKFTTYFCLKKKGFQVYLWDTSSSDADIDDFNLKRSFDELIKTTHPGSVVLFHFSNELGMNTRQILPIYLKWLINCGYNFATL